MPMVAPIGSEASGRIEWALSMGGTDFTDPANFYYPILGCGGAVEGRWNWSKSCNDELDAMAAEADAISDPARADERLGMWTEIYTRVVDGRCVATAWR